MNNALLVSMPFGALDRPSLGISLLKAQLRQADLPCDIRYLMFAFAELIGYEEYQWLLFDAPYTAILGDWLFTGALYEEGEPPFTAQPYVREILQGTWQFDPQMLNRLARIRSLVPHFLDHCLAVVPWDEYSVVGFTSTFQQNIASLALAKRIKAAYPHLTIVFGGANWEGEMGQELHRQFPFVDYVCSGEAEDTFLALMQALNRAGPPDSAAIARIPGVVFRQAGESIFTGGNGIVHDMDALPIPAFDDYFRDLEQSTIAALVTPILLIETARGCWWGAKSQCMFCGLNGGTMGFRSKSPTRALDELLYLVERWRIDFVEAVDNIMDMRYFEELLPALARLGEPIRLFYEVKSNLKRAQIELLRAAGVQRVQAGIESISDHVLRLMRKGTTALQNIQTLKWCKESEIVADWNLLYGFPGETQEDYDGILAMLPAIRFLNPPTAHGPVRLDRFSPYFEAPGEHGLIDVRPTAPYRYLYPVNLESLHRIAYYFDYSYRPDVDPTGHAARVIQFVEDWQQRPESGVLTAFPRPDGSLTLLDTRSDAAWPDVTLTGIEKWAYEYCDEVRGGAQVTRYLQGLFPNAQLTPEHVTAFLDSLVANRLMVTDGKRYLSLALVASAPEPVPGGPVLDQAAHAQPLGIA